jgi:hypothetical protein
MGLLGARFPVGEVAAGLPSQGGWTPAAGYQILENPLLASVLQVSTPRTT